MILTILTSIKVPRYRLLTKGIQDSVMVRSMSLVFGGETITDIRGTIG